MFTVVASDVKLNTGKLAGAEMHCVKLKVDDTENIVRDMFIDHPNCHWKWFPFIKACGVEIAEGQDFHFDAQAAKDAGAQHIPLVGLRGRAYVVKAERNGKTYNEVKRYVFGPALERVEVEEDDVPF